ncbi:hypothetical protein Trydic_g12754 [Trypoxylus dichotomus]
MYLHGNDERIGILYYYLALYSFRHASLESAPSDREIQIIGCRRDGDVSSNLPNFGINRFKGTVVIDVTCVSPTENITLHSKALKINTKGITVRTADSDENLSVTNAHLVDEDDFLVISLEDQLKEDEKYKVKIPFEGKLGETLAGYYRSSYTAKDGKKHWLAVTQFEPSDARYAFPCFDEPAMKAKFTISLGRKDDLTSISNMPLIKTENIEGKPGWQWDRFETTVPMSTYLVAFAVTDFVYETAPKHGNNVTFRIWCRKDAVDQIAFAKDVGPKALAFYEQFFDIPYPLPKQDMIAVPDFSAGAMENWGLITYRETYLLFDPKKSSAVNKINVASVVSHELAHQWFGNLVTMKWWTDLWLNEGFATYMASVAVEDIFPEWKSQLEETADNILAMFSFDSLASSHPVSVPIGNPKEIDEIFDTISYKKGSSLLHMVSNFLGSESFRKGVSNYLKEHKYNNAEKDDLFKSLTDEAHNSAALPKNLTVKEIMDTWTLQTGYPVIYVKRNYDDGTATITQERFFKDANHTEDTSKWWIPLTYTTASESAFDDIKVKKWFPAEDDEVTIEDLPSSDEWVIFNLQATGLYRVNYDEKNWNLLIDVLKSSKYKQIPPLNRVLLFDNAANFAWTKRIPYELYFKLIGYLQHEDEYVPWKGAIRSTDILDVQLKRTPVYDKFKQFMAKNIEPIYGKIGGFRESKTRINDFDKIQHKVLVTGIGCRYQTGDCVDKARKIMENVMARNLTDHDGINNDLRGTIYCNGVRYGGEKEWKFLWNMYLSSNVASVKSTILRSLGCSRRASLLKSYLDSAMNDDLIRKQDVVGVFAAVILNDVGFIVAKEYINDNIKRIHDRLTPNFTKLSSVINTLAQHIINDEEYKWLVSFTKKNKEYFREVKNGIKQALEAAKVNAQWHNENYETVKKILKSGDF